MIIFGWNRQTVWFIGQVLERHCEHCGNTGYWLLFRRTTWFTLFFIPVIPYKTEWLYICPICKDSVQLNSGQIEKYKLIAELNKRAVDGEVTESEFAREFSRLSSMTEDKKYIAPVHGEIVREISQDKIDDLVHCLTCSSEIDSDSDFCKKCGSKNEKKTK